MPFIAVMLVLLCAFPVRAGEPVRPLLLDPGTAPGETITFLENGPRIKAFVRDFARPGAWRDAYSADDASYRAFAANVRTHVDPDPIELLRRQRRLYAAAFPEMLARFDGIIAGRLGRIRPISRLEAALFLVQIDWFGSLSEFEAYFLEKDSRIRVYYAGSGELSPPSVPAIRERIDRDRKDGWTVQSHLHNHPFMFDNDSGDIAGTTIPSGDGDYGDVGTYRRLRDSIGLASARVTNGFHVLDVAASQFDALASSAKNAAAGAQMNGLSLVGESASGLTPGRARKRRRSVFLPR